MLGCRAKPAMVRASCLWSSPSYCRPQPPLCVRATMPSTLGKSLSTLAIEPLGNVLADAGRAVDRRDHGEVVPRAHLAAAAAIAQERAATQRLGIGGHVGRVLILAIELPGRHVVRVNPLARLDAASREADGLTVLQDSLACGNGLQGDLVSQPHRLAQSHAVRSRRDLVARLQVARGDADDYRPGARRPHRKWPWPSYFPCKEGEMPWSSLSQRPVSLGVAALKLLSTIALTSGRFSGLYPRAGSRHNTARFQGSLRGSARLGFRRRVRHIS